MAFHIVLVLLSVSLVSGTCPTGWAEFDGECFYFGHTAKTWPDAEASCRSKGAYLVSDDNPKKHEFLKGYLNVLTTWNARHFWLGGTDYVIEGQWRWVETGVPMTGFSIWGPGYPKGDLGHSCLSSYFNGTEMYWQDAVCGTATQHHGRKRASHSRHTNNYVCEKQVLADQSNQIIG